MARSPAETFYGFYGASAQDWWTSEIPAQQRFGIFASTRAVTDSHPKPAFLPPLPPTFMRGTAVPLPTAAQGDRVFDPQIRYPRGDVGAQQFGRPSTSLSGAQWTSAPAPRKAAEVGASRVAPADSERVRAWLSPRAPFIMYQADHRAASPRLTARLSPRA